MNGNAKAEKTLRLTTKHKGAKNSALLATVVVLSCCAGSLELSFFSPLYAQKLRSLKIKLDRCLFLR